MAGYSKGLKKAGIGIAAIGAIATVAAVAVFKFTSAFAKQGDELAKASKRIGIGVVALQELQFAAERSGVAVGQIEKGLAKLAIAVDEVRSGELTEVGKALLRLGGGIEEAILKGADLEELIPLIADRFKAMEDSITKTTIASDVFGLRIGSNLIPLFDEGSEGLATLAAEFRKLGFITEETAAKAEAFVDAQRNLKQATTSLKGVIARELMPQLTIYLNTLATWIAKNDELIGQKVEGILKGIVEVLPAMITLVQGAAKAFQLMADGITKVGKAGAFIGKAIADQNAFNTLQKSKAAGRGFTEEDLNEILLKDVKIVEALDIAWLDLNETVEEGKKVVNNYIPAITGAAAAITDAEQAILDFEDAQEAFTQSIDDQIESVQKEIALFNATTEAVIEYEINQLRAQLANEGFNESIIKKIELLEKERLALAGLESDQVEREEQQRILEENLEKQQQAIEDSLQGIQTFAAAVAANINTAFADTLTELVFDFENFGDALKNVFRGILNSFFQLISTIATNPIRIGIEQSLGGGGGGAAGAVGGIGGVLGGLGSSFGALGSLFGIGGGGGVAAGSAAGLTGLFATGGAGFLATLGAAIPAIGVIIAAAAIAIPIIMDLLESKPRLDVDIGVVKDEMGKRAALVSEFLDPSLIDDVINISVKRKAGLGVGGDDAIKSLISDSIVASIEAIQSIISKLPQDMVESLNEMLLDAEVDILSLIKGDKLLEFDESKKIAERFQQFLEGDLPARFFASIRDSFFGPMLVSLGVASDAVQVMMDDFLASLQGATREERIILGQEFLATIDAYVDVFNLLNEGMKGVMAQAISDVTALAASLDIKAASGIPTLREIERALEDLFEAGLLTAETAQNFILLRQAVIELTIGLSRSISNITSIISKLDADIVGLGGSAVGTSAGIDDAIDSLQNLLDNEALSLDEREAILNELNSLADQLGATELANQQQAIQASVDSVNSQIQSLQLLKTVEAEKNQASLDALNKELSIAEGLESILEGIRRTIVSMQLATGGPESVFERIARARGDVASLFGQLASAAPEDQAGIASQLQDLLNELDTLRQEAFQSPSAESDDLFREIILNLEKLEGLIEPARSSEEIQSSIEAIETASQELLSSIDSQIESFQSNLTGLQSAGNQLTGEVAERVRELKEAIRAEFVEILAERIEQLGEVSGTGFEAMIELEEEHSIVFREQADTLQVIAANTAQLASAPQLGFGFDIPGFAGGSNGFQNFGKGTLAMLHGVEAVLKPEDIIKFKESVGGSPVSVSLNLPAMNFSASQVVNPESFMRELMKKLHDRRVTDEIIKVVRGCKNGR